MDVEEAIILWLYYKQKYGKRRPRLWVSPILQSRLTTSLYVTLYPKLRDDEPEFICYFKMSIKSFDDLLLLIQDDISADRGAIRYCISPEEKLIITLRYLASGCSMTELHYAYKTGKSTICEMIRQVCRVIWMKLKDNVMPVPDKEKWIEISQGYEQHAKFPHCIGAVNGKHIRRVKPKLRSHKQHLPLMLFALCDVDYLFTWIDIEAYRTDSDSGFFKNSILYEKLIDGSLAIPDPIPLTDKDETVMPYVFVGNEAFGLMKNLMRPYGGNILTDKKKVFNYRLSLARKYIECAFGILSNRWKILNRQLDVSINCSKQIIKTITVLHNYIGIRDGYNYDDTLKQNLKNINSAHYGRPTVTAHKIRAQFTEYFMNEGRIEGQDESI